MKILNIIGSHRKNGNTVQIVRQIQDQLEALAASQGAPLEVETLYLGQKDLALCRGCRVCFDRGEEKCPLKDEFSEIKAKMKASDGWIVASPVYVGDVSGTMKNWIDRLAHVCHRPEFADKSVYLIATTGGSSTKHTIRTLQSALISWGAHLVGWKGFKMGARMAPAEVQRRYQAEAARIARKLFEAILSEKYKKPSFFSLMVFKTMQWHRSQYEPGSLDYQYWLDQGWTHPEREYFIQHQANRLTVLSARLVGTILAVLYA
jgi:multimeric flavodoxin WrbA